MNLQEFKKSFDSLYYDKFFQDIECINFKGVANSDITWKKIQELGVDFTDKNVLDFGSYHGFFSFKAESSGARSVTGLDRYVFLIDVSSQIKSFINSNVHFEKWREGEPFPHADVALVLNILHLFEDIPLFLKNLKIQNVVFEVPSSLRSMIEVFFDMLAFVENEKNNTLILHCARKTERCFYNLCTNIQEELLGAVIAYHSKTSRNLEIVFEEISKVDIDWQNARVCDLSYSTFGFLYFAKRMGATEFFASLSENVDFDRFMHTFLRIPVKYVSDVFKTKLPTVNIIFVGPETDLLTELQFAQMLCNINAKTGIFFIHEKFTKQVESVFQVRFKRKIADGVLMVAEKFESSLSRDYSKTQCD